MPSHNSNNWRALFAHLVLIFTTGGCDAARPPSETKIGVREVSSPRIESFLEEMSSEEHFTGAVLVARGTMVIHAKGYGPATGDEPNDVATLFHVASITKQFTAAAIMQLVEDSVLDLDESVNQYLPEAYTTPQWDAVTVHHLLSHTSGITDYAVTRDYYDVVDGFCLGGTVDGMVREAMGKNLEFTPGSRYSYSNIGFTLLGFIIENQANEPYSRYLEEHVLRPMGMHRSIVHVEGHRPVANEAAGYRWSEEHGTHVPDDIVSLPVTAPDGGLLTTLSDFLTWSQIYAGADQSILSRSSIEKMTARHIDTGQGGPLNGYGYGLSVGDRLIGHGGYIVGFRSQFVFDRETDLLIAVFTNNTSNNPQRIMSGLLSISLAPQS